MSRFKLTNFYLVNANPNGTLRKASVLPKASTSMQPIGKASIENEIDVDGFYLGEMYVPEVGDIKNEDYTTSTSLIIEGDYASPTDHSIVFHRFYRLDFIRIDGIDDEGVENFTVLDAIERNHRYIFSIDYLAPTAGWSTLAEAMANEPENIIGDSKTQLAIITQEEIKSITTDQFVYLGITSDELYASESESSPNYYWTSFYVMTNNSQGWRLDELPQGVSVTCSEWKGSNEEQIPVVVWLSKDNFKSGDKVTLLIFSSRIRKTVDIYIP